MMLPTPLTDRYCASVVVMVKWQHLALRAGAAGQIAPEHGLEADRELLLGQQRALGHAEHEFRSHLLRGTHQLRSTATEQAILRKVSENRAPIAPLHHPNEGWELLLHQRQRGVFTRAPRSMATPAARARPALSTLSESSERMADPAAGGTVLYSSRVLHAVQGQNYHVSVNCGASL